MLPLIANLAANDATQSLAVCSSKLLSVNSFSELRELRIRRRKISYHCHSIPFNAFSPCAISHLQSLYSHWTWQDYRFFGNWRDFHDGNEIHYLYLFYLSFNFWSSFVEKFPTFPNFSTSSVTAHPDSWLWLTECIWLGMCKLIWLANAWLWRHVLCTESTN